MSSRMNIGADAVDPYKAGVATIGRISRKNGRMGSLGSTPKEPIRKVATERPEPPDMSGMAVGDTVVIKVPKGGRSNATNTAQVNIPRPDIRTIQFKILGVTPLIMHKFSDKAKREMEEKTQKKAKQAKEARDPKAEYDACFHYLSDGKTYAFPANAIRKAMVAACSFIDGIPKTFARGSFFVMGTKEANMVEIVGKPRMGEDTVRLKSGSSMVRYRPYFDKWHCTFRIDYNARCITPDQLGALIQNAGFSIGIGDWRPSSLSPGVCGKFRLAEGGE